MMRLLAIWRTHRTIGRSIRLVLLIVCFAANWLVAADSPPATEKQVPEPAHVCQTFRVREQDQVWLVSTRHLGCGLIPSFQVWRYENGIWQPKTEADFFAEDSADLVTPIYIHGNRLTASEASSYGLSFYFELVGKLDDEQPARFVIWSWPSDQIKGPLQDLRVKADRSDYEAYYVATFASRMKTEVRVGLLGYSYGARIISGAMHIAGGGALLGYSLPKATFPCFRVAMWAAAEHNHWYLPGQFHSHALAAAEAWFITVNCCDPALARYRFVDKCGDPVAVGFAGICGRNQLPADVNARIEEVNVANIIGSDHNWRPYLYSLYIQSRTRDYILWHDLGFGATKEETIARTAAKQKAIPQR